MSEKRFQIIHLGNPYEFVVKDNATNKTYGPFEGDEKSMSDLLNVQAEIIKRLVFDMDLIANTKLFSRRKLEEENKQMKKQLEKIPKSIREVWLE